MITRLVTLLLIIPSVSPQDAERNKALAEIEKLENRLAAMKPGTFDWGLHNSLRHHYGIIHRRKSMRHVEAIFRNNPRDDYMLQILGGKNPDTTRAIAAMNQTAREFPDLPHTVAACRIQTAALTNNPRSALAILKRAESMPGLSPKARETISDLINLDSRFRVPWPKRIPIPTGMENAPGPWNDTDNLSIWPNQVSRANSDSWIVANHDKIRTMKPRLLVINFSNEHTPQRARQHVDKLIDAIAESSRYHGYRDPKAPAFLQYRVFKYVDLRDRDRTKYNSRLTPVKEPRNQPFNMKYRDFFSEEFAKHYGVPDPRDPKRFLRLDELVDGGYVHELWFLNAGTPEPGKEVTSYEAVEEKPAYDESFRRKGNSFVQAGNGGDPEQPWIGRSLRINSINLDRGVGCAMENLGHALEGTSNSGAIPYFSRYFREYSGHDLKERHGLPIDSLYGARAQGPKAVYPNPSTMIVNHDGKEYRVENYVCAGGNVHFAPNGRDHYDLGNTAPVLSTIENWRAGGGPNGKDLAKPFTNAAFARYSEKASDCQGPWLVYWRQNMPGLANQSKDDQGRPMKNWWPFLFY